MWFQNIKNNIISILLTIISQFCFQAAYADDLQFYSADFEFSSKSISAIAQDSHGYMWFGTTNSGVIRYAPNRAKIYARIPFSKEYLPSSQVQCMFMENDDVLWIGTFAGLSKLDTHTGKIQNFLPESDIVCSIFRDSKGQLWVGTLNGLFAFDEKNNSYKLYEPKSERHLENATVRNLYEDSNGTLFACTYGGLFIYDRQKDCFVRPDYITKNNPACNGTVYNIAEDTDGSYWIIVWDVGLIHVQKNSKQFEVIPLPDNRTYTMNTQYRPGIILIGTWGGGLHTFNKSNHEIVSYNTTKHGTSKLTHDVIYCTFKDSNGLLWVGTHGGGVNMYDAKRTWFRTPSFFTSNFEAISGKPIEHIAQSSDGELWLTILNSGVVRCNIKNGKLHSYTLKTNGITPDITYFTKQHSDGTIYAGTNRGLAKYNPSSDQFIKVDWYRSIAEKYPIVFTMEEDFDGSLWLGIFGIGLLHCSIDGKTQTLYEHNPNDKTSLSNPTVYSILCDSKNRLWVCTNKGFNKFNRDTHTFTSWFYDVNNPNGLPANSIISIAETSDGKIWIGTKESMFSIFDPEKNIYQNFTFDDDLVSKKIYQFTESSNGEIFITSNLGGGFGVLCGWGLKHSKNIRY